MITANQIHARRAQQQFQAFCRKWADAYCIACVKNRVGTLLPNCSQEQPEVQANCRGHLSGPLSSCPFQSYFFTLVNRANLHALEPQPYEPR